MCLKFARNCKNNELTKDLFPLNPVSGMGTREKPTYKVQHANTDRLKDSAVPYLQRLERQSVEDGCYVLTYLVRYLPRQKGSPSLLLSSNVNSEFLY